MDMRSVTNAMAACAFAFVLIGPASAAYQIEPDLKASNAKAIGQPPIQLAMPAATARAV